MTVRYACDRCKKVESDKEMGVVWIDRNHYKLCGKCTTLYSKLFKELHEQVTEQLERFITEYKDDS